MDFENASLYQTLRERYGVHPHRTELALTTVAPDAAVFTLLGETPRSPALVTLRGHAYDSDDRQIEQIEIVYSSSIEFKISTTMPSTASSTRNENTPRCPNAPHSSTASLPAPSCSAWFT